MIKRKPQKKVKSFNKMFFRNIIYAWLFMIMFLGVAFAGFTSGLTTEGMASIQAHIFDYVYISHVSISDSSNASSIQYSFMDHEINANIAASACNSYVTYELDVVNTTPYKAFFTSGSVVSMINGNGNNTSTIDVDLYDVVFNDTYVSPHSTKKVHIKLKNNCTGSDEQVRVKANFEYSLYRYFDLTVNCNPNDGTVEMTTQEGTYTGTGSVTHRVAEGDTATYKCNRRYYYEGTGSYTMGTLDHSETLTLAPDPHRDLTINASPSSTTIIVKQNNNIVCSGTESLVCSVLSNENVTYTVDEPEFYYTYTNNVYSGYEETFLMPATETTKSITLLERPWITGTTSNTSNTTAATMTGVNWHPGYYLVEVWGGAGGTGNQTKGASGYVYGVVYISYETSVYATVGGNGSSAASQPSGGANGGATGGSSGTGTGGNKGGGGGYSAFVVGASEVNQNNINNGYVKIIAGGGGGASSRGGTFGTSDGGNGGNGGTLTSTKSTITAGSVYSGSNGTSSNSGTPGGGGSTTGGSAGTSASAGSFLSGGNGYERGGGGGAGYYGGGGGGISSIFATAPGGGGGGSSFVANGVTSSGLASSVTSKLTSTNPSSTGGAVIITYIGKTM